MRDSFGGAFMIKLFLIFIVIYVGFIAMALNYAKAFRVKNKILDYLEVNEITSLSMLQTGTGFNEFENYVESELRNKLNYNMSDLNVCDLKNYETDGIVTYEGKNIYCSQSGFIIRETGKSENTRGVYYTVTTYVRWSLPFLNTLIGGSVNDEDSIRGTWKITGETRIVVRD